MSNYLNVKRWRSKAKNKDYSSEYMKKQRAFFRMKWLKGEINYVDVPRAYRYWVDKK
jgi:hypothetical protein